MRGLGEEQGLLAEFGQERERELCAVERARQMLFHLDEMLLRRAPLHQPLAFGEVFAQVCDGPFDALGDLTGVLVTHGFGELRARVGERSQRVPAFDHVVGGTGEGVEGPTQRLGRGLQLLGEHHLFLAAQRAGAADLLEVGLERPPLAARVQVFCGDGCFCA